MTLRIVVCHISFLKFEYFTQRRREAEHAEVFYHTNLNHYSALSASLYLCAR